MSLIKRYFKPPTDESFFLFGPRGTGKSTLMKKLYPDAIWIDFLNPEIQRSFEKRPEQLYDYLKATPHKKTVVIDEVQKTPKVLSTIHDIIEQKQSIQFILTCSSIRKIKKTGADLLGGRALHCHLHPFMASECATKDFNLDEALCHGLLPLIYQKTNKPKLLQAYLSLYLKEEIQMEGLARNMDDFSRFLEAISFSHGAVLNVSNIARNCQVKRKTVEGYIHILEDLLLVNKLSVFSRKAKRALIHNKKIYLFDPGLFSTLRSEKSPGTEHDGTSFHGAALEGLVFQHLKAWRDYSTQEYQLSFWRTRAGVEVDFVIYGETEFVALEVKNTKNINPKDTNGIKAFLTDYPMAKAAILYRGKERMLYYNVLCIPVTEFLTSLTPNQPLHQILKL